MTVTKSLVKQLSVHESVTARELRNILMGRSPEGTLQEQLLTYWYPIPGTRSHEHAFGTFGNRLEPFTRYVVRTDLVNQPGEPSWYHTFLDQYTPNEKFNDTDLDEDQGFPISGPARVELERQRAVTESYTEHFTDGPPESWATTLPVVRYMDDLGVLPHLGIMPFGAVQMLLGQRVTTVYDVTSPEWPGRSAEYRALASPAKESRTRSRRA